MAVSSILFWLRKSLKGPINEVNKDNIAELYFHSTLILITSLVSDIAMDWSDHAIWWPSQNKWLDKTRWTLDQYNVNADTVIHFTPMHKTLR